MSVRGLLAAVVILIALAGAFWWSETKDKKDDSAASSKDNPKLVLVKDEDVSRLDLVKREGETITVQREKSGWALTAPKAVRTDTDAVAGVVSTFTGLTWDRLVEEKAADVTTFGLTTPDLKATLTAKDGKKITLLVGDATPTSGGYFAKLEGDARVFSITGATKSAIDKGWRELRDKRLITIDDSKLSRVELNATGKGAPVEFGKTGQNEWQVLKPKPVRADNFQVEELIRKVREAKLEASGTDETDRRNAAEFAVATRVAVVSLTDPSGTQTLDVRKKGEDLYAKSSAGEDVAKVTKEFADSLAKGLDDFRQKKIFDFGFAEPTKLDIRDNGKAYAFTKSGEKWMAGGKEMDATSVQSLIDKLRDLQATKLSETGFGTPVAEISVTSLEGKRTEKVSASKGASAWFAKRENEATVYEIDAAKMDDILRAAGEVKPPPPPAPPAAPAKK